ncbi:hypothetical protein BDV95DRAFT_597235 [Massariosphaeria phaeospora]|uniref:Zn(2)-C6 fungal-type domain-containing protein n=1 Tax=Massariosphaeria phaeospora TaxID=100035 RepID=A0A7C8I1J9_9PLEO|nr:hypothetical protein BDV95DRAFT_597235 [Massariosphaeria phaeospora]
MASVALSRSVHRPVKTCTECKQVKLRCDSRAKFPAPCSRCQLRGHQCIVDSSFRRTPARKRVEDMARELEALKSQRHEDGSKSTVSPSTRDESSSPAYSIVPVGTAVLDESEALPETFHLGDFIIDKATTVDIFRIYCNLFFPHFPIINPTVSIRSMHAIAPLLFWSIVAIVTSHEIRPSYGELFSHLDDFFLQQLRANVLQAPVPLHTIQALQLLLMWPLPAERQTNDPSWLYSGAAINAAMYMGIHHPKHTQSLRSIGVPSGSPRARANTWLGCFLSSTSLSMFVGLPPPISGNSDLATIEQFLREYPIPQEFAYQIMVQHTLAKYTTVLLDDTGETINQSLVKVIDTELDGLRGRLSVEWTPRVEFSLLVAKLHLYTMTVIRMQSDLTSRDIFTKLGLSVGLRIIYLCDRKLSYGTEEFGDLPDAVLHRTFPKIYFRGLALATVFLLRYFVLSNQASAEERELACNHVAKAHHYFKTGSTHPQDERARVAILFESLSRQQPVNLDQTKLRVDNRMSASLVYDAISTGHELRNEPSELEEPVANANHEPETNRVSFSFDQHQTTDGLGFDPNVMPDFGSMDFPLPEDMWGDSLWQMFDFGVVPSQN